MSTFFKNGVLIGALLSDGLIDRRPQAQIHQARGTDVTELANLELAVTAAKSELAVRQPIGHSYLFSTDPRICQPEPPGTAVVSTIYNC